MNIVGILKKYTKQSILDEIKVLFQPDDYTLFKYEKLLETMLKKIQEEKESKYTLYFEMQFDTDNNDFRLYALENNIENGQEVDISKLSVLDTICAEIDEELYMFMEEKTIIAKLLHEILNFVYGESNMKIIKVNLEDMISDEISPFNSILEGIMSFIDNFEDSIKESLKIKNIGDFYIESGEIILADPSEFEIKNNPNIIKVKKGLWTSEIASSSENNKPFSLVLKHNDYREKNYNCISIDEDGEDCNNSISIMNNMIAAVELNSFRNDSLLDKNYEPINNFGLIFKNNENNEPKREKWYGKCCDITLENECGAGIIPNGVVASTVFKNGNLEYTIFKSKDDEIIAIRIYLMDYEQGVNSIKGGDIFNE